MSSSLTRLLAVGTAAAVALVGFSPAAASVAAPAPTPAAIVLPAASRTTTALNKAATWLADHPASVDDGYGRRVDAALGLAVADTARTAATLREWVAALQPDAAAESASVGTALKLAILLDVLHEDPRDFGGTDVIAAAREGIDASGQVGGFASAYSQALAIIALKRAGEPVPGVIVTTLLSFQDQQSGAFGYEWPVGTFNADPDSTALAIQALDLIRGSRRPVARAAINKAVVWAKANQTPAGYWAAYSPVDSTALLASALKQVGAGYGKAKTWLLGQQLADGGFPASLDGTDSDVLATATATSLLKGTSLAKASYRLKGYTRSPRPRVTGTARVGETLTVLTGRWEPRPTFAFQWYRNGKKIAQATERSYVLTADDRGRKIRVRLKADGIGLKTDYEYSKYTSTVKQALAG